MRKKQKTMLGTALCYLAVFGLLLLFLFPVYWLVISSLQINGDITTSPPNFFPKSITLEHYAGILSNGKYLNYIKNSLFVSGSTVLLSIVVSVFAGYALSRYDFRGRSVFMSTILNVQIFPVTVIVISLFTFYSSLNLMDTYTGLILANFVYAIPFTIWFLKSFFDTIPKSLDESAKIDGCSNFAIVVRITLPLVRPGLVAVGIYAFLRSWDDFMFALIIMKSDAHKTLPLGIAQSFMGEFLHNYGGMMAMAVIASIPVVVFFLVFQKQFVSGLTSGAVKG